MTTIEPTPALTPFKETTEPGYANRFIDRGLTHEELPGGGVILYGHCPRCDAPIQAFLPTSTVRSAAPSPPPPVDDRAPTAPGGPPPAADSRADGPGTPFADTVPLVCTCTQCDHPGRPAEYPDGCGAYWLITIDQADA